MAKRAFSFSDLFSDRLWSLSTDAMSRGWQRLVHFVKVLRITVDSFAENRMGFQCVALSYFVTLAIIPFIAFVFAVSGGLGVQDKVDTLLHSVLPSIVDQSLVEIAVEKAGNIIESASSGPVGVVSFLMFMWTIIWLMFQTERVFNNVWGIRKIPRNIFKRFGFYIGLMILLPFVIIIFSYGIAYATNATRLIGIDTAEWNWLRRTLGWLGLYGLTTLTLSAMYKYIPAVRVRYKHALNAAAFDAIAFVVFQYLYLETQMFVGRLNAVYGVIAAIPLFLIWLNFSFQIIIYGAQLSYGLQNIDQYHSPSWDNYEDNNRQ